MKGRGGGKWPAVLSAGREWSLSGQASLHSFMRKHLLSLMHWASLPRGWRANKAENVSPPGASVLLGGDRQQTSKK